MKLTSLQSVGFEARIDEWVLAGLRAGARDLDSLVRRLPSVYPTDVIDSLNRLSLHRVISTATRDAILTAASKEVLARGSRSASRLPTPHPLDFDWRFAEEAVDTLLRFSLELGETLACMGTPSVFVRAVKELGVDQVELFDSNRSVVRHVKKTVPGARVHRLNLFNDLIPRTRSDVVVADPPWYIEHAFAFLWAASQICRVRGHVLISLPPRGTRPTIDDELLQVLRYSSRIGFRLRHIKEDHLPYETPPFESNSLSAVGCRLCGRPWRRGTLCVFQKIKRTCTPRPRFESPGERWSEASLYGTRFKFRHRRLSGFDDPSLRSLVDGDILPTVSRRERLREQVDVWSSGNRVFRCSAPGILRRIVECLDAGASPADKIENSRRMSLSRPHRRQIQRAAEQIEGIALTENSERRFFGKG